MRHPHHLTRCRFIAMFAVLAGLMLLQQTARASEQSYVFKEASIEGRKIICMEAEHHASLGTGRVACMAHASGGRFLYSSDEEREHKEKLVAGYRFKVNTPGRWYIRIRTFAAHHMQNGLFLAVDGKRLRHPDAERSKDHVVRDGTVILSKSGWGWDAQWQRIKPACPPYIDIEQPGEHTLSILRREVMTYYDKILLTHEDSWSPYKTSQGPEETVLSAGTDWQGPLSYALHGVEDFPYAGSGFERMGFEGWGRSPHLILAKEESRAAVATPFPGKNGLYDIRLEYLADERNQTEYRILIGGKLIASHLSGPGAEPPDDEPTNHYIRDVALQAGQEIRLEAMTKNGCRARWRRLFFYGKKCYATPDEGMTK